MAEAAAAEPVWLVPKALEEAVVLDMPGEVDREVEADDAGEAVDEAADADEADEDVAVLAVDTVVVPVGWSAVNEVNTEYASDAMMLNRSDDCANV